MNKLAVQPALDTRAVDSDADVVPAAGFDAARMAIHRAVQFEGVLSVIPAADVPPDPVFVIQVVEEDQEAFAASELARFEFERVIGPRFVPNLRANEFALRSLPKHAVLNLPVSAVTK